MTASGSLQGFVVKIIAPESLKLETQIIGKMLDRIGFKVTIDILSFPELHRKTYIPLLDKPPEGQDWDIALFNMLDLYGNTGASLLNGGLLEDGEFRWIEYDSIFERLWKDMARTKDRALQQKKIRETVKYVYDQAYLLFVYVPLSLYAVNKEVDFIPQRCGLSRLKETSVTENHWSLRGKND